MEDRVYLINIYDYYGELLTDKQRTYFEEYYFNNLSLQEISDLYQISRNAIHKQLKEASDHLYYFEEKLNLFKKGESIKKLIEKLDNDKLKEEIESLL